MPPKRNHHQKNNKPPISGGGSMSDCVLPQDMMLCIVTRLPVKSIHRFKAVCKPWRKLFTTPKFMKMHQAHLSQNPENQSVMIYNFTEKQQHTMSLFRIESSEKKPTNLVHPCPGMLYEMDFVGCCYGLICITNPPRGQMIELWNPALGLSKSTAIPKLKSGEPRMISLGFGYDDEADDFKVVRIVSVEKKKQGKKMTVGVEVYSANSDSWKRVEPGFQFSVYRTKSEAIVNGNPYWAGKIGENCVMVCFDVRKMEFEFVPLSLNLGGNGELFEAAFVDWKGAIAAIVCKKDENERVLSLDVRVFDGVEKIWIKKRRFRTMELRAYRFVQCLKNGEIIGECNDGKVLVLDADEENGGGGVKKEVVIDKGSIQVCGYTESLAYIKGMEKVKVKKAKDMLRFFQALN